MIENCPHIELGQITTTINGLWTGKKPPFQTVAVIRNTNFSKDCKLKMDDVAMIEVETRQFASRKLQVGDIIIEKSGGSEKQPVGRPILFNIKDGDYSFSNFTATLRVINKDEVLPEYLHKFLYGFYLTGKTAAMQSKTTGLHNLDFNAFKRILVPIPSPERQLHIVNELNLLEGIIEKKNEQLKAFDKLIESFFYEMFGVPAESTDTKYPIRDYANCIAGATPSTLVKSYWENGTIPWLSSGEVAKGRITETDTKITQEGYDSCSTRLVPKDSVLVAMAGQGKTRGTVGITDIELCTNQSICSIVINKDTLLPTFLYYQLKYLYNELRSISNGDGGRGGLNLKLIGQFKIMVPQIEKQSLFVEKAVFIEKEKLLIKESIKPLEQLLAKRMDKYFSE